MYCPNCGNRVGVNEKFCGFCGTPLTAPGSQPTNVAPGSIPANADVSSDFVAGANPVPAATASVEPGLGAFLGKNKRIVAVAAVVAVAVIAVIVVSNLVGGGSANSQVVGTWYAYDSDSEYDSDSKYILEIKEDGTYIYQCLSGTFSGTWSLNEDVITFTADASKQTSSGILEDTYRDEVGDFITVTYNPRETDTVGDRTYERP